MVSCSCLGVGSRCQTRPASYLPCQIGLLAIPSLCGTLMHADHLATCVGVDADGSDCRWGAYKLRRLTGGNLGKEGTAHLQANADNCMLFARRLADTSLLLDQVVGAGRGPLVRAALNAARQTERRLKIYAIEKNPNAVVTLHKLVAAER